MNGKSVGNKQQQIVGTIGDGESVVKKLRLCTLKQNFGIFYQIKCLNFQISHYHITRPYLITNITCLFQITQKKLQFIISCTNLPQALMQVFCLKVISNVFYQKYFYRLISSR